MLHLVFSSPERSSGRAILHYPDAGVGGVGGVGGVVVGVGGVGVDKNVKDLR